MTAKEYLRQIKQLNTIIKNLEDEIKARREDQISIRSAWPDGQPHGTGTTDPTGTQAIDLVEELNELEHRQRMKRVELWRKRNEIIETLGKLDRAEYNRLLYLRYVQGRTWEEIAVEMHYTYQWVAGPLHGNALQALDKILITVDIN